jgi:hypothetical protein
MTEGMEIFKGDRQFSILKVLKFLSFRPFSFIIPVGGEEFTDSFLKLLDSSGRNVKIS